MSNIHMEYLFQDRESVSPDGLSDYSTLDFASSGKHLYGVLLWPDGAYRESRPCVLMFHGFPGSARNDDIAQALCRIGCVVVVPHHRGAWGSEGNYLISHCIEDAVNLAQYVRSAEFCDKYRVDPDAIFLLGHSMGGNTVLNAARALPWLRGLILLAPFDPTRYLQDGREHLLRELLKQGSILRSDGLEEIYRDIYDHRKEIAFTAVPEKLREQNLLILAGEYDKCAPPEEMVMPLWDLLAQHPTSAVQRLKVYPTEHGLLGRRIAATTDIAEFLAAACP